MTALPSQPHSLNLSEFPASLGATLVFGSDSAPFLASSLPRFVAPEPMPWPGVLHEIFAAPTGGEIGRFSTHHPFPAGALIGWAARQLRQSKGRLTVWIGRRVWPYPLVLRRAGLLGGSLFVDATDNNQRLWAAELALRCCAVASVIADGSGFSMSATRRLQLISRGSDVLMLLARPSLDERQLSAAGARWRISAVPARVDSTSPQWMIELLRCKGVRPASLGCHGQSHPAWRLRWDAESASSRLIDTEVEHERELCDTSASATAAPVSGGLPADLAGRPAHAPPAAPRRAG